MTKKKNVQTPHAPIFNHLGDGGPHVKNGSNIDIKKKESTSYVLVWRRIKYTDVDNCHGKEFPCEAKREREIHGNEKKNLCYSQYKLRFVEDENA